MAGILMLHGIFLLDKPTGVSSNHVLQQVKRLFRAKKAGHTGSLDPLASGMLPICLGEATKFSQYLLDADKTYQVTMQLGVRTNTSDADGEVISTRSVPDFSLAEIIAVLNTFVGQTMQIPTMFSAIKYQGRRLYDYARKGIAVDRQARPIVIYAINEVSVEGPYVTCRVSCGKGTYIRTLVDDVGEKLGSGAHVTALRRLSVSGFAPEKMMTIEALSALEDLNAALISMDSGVTHFPTLPLSNSQARDLYHGKIVPLSMAVMPGLMRLYEESGVFVGMGEVKENGIVVARRMVTV